tara:strand:+ start:32 stop:1708 length:1677 start_codon:yes stop_codon:yes gene_type:complete
MGLNKDEILKNINSFLGADNELAIKEAEHQIKIFEVILEKEIEEFNKSESNKLENPEKDPKNIEIIKSIKLFRDELKRKKEKRKIEEKENTETKKQILKEFQNLINSKEKLSDLASGIKEIKNRWNKIDNISIPNEHSLQREFSKLNEAFNYNFNIYKELKENDLKRNFSLKNQIIYEIKELAKIKDIKKVQTELKLLQTKWEEIGPTFKEHWDEIKKNYWAEVNLIQKRIREFYNNLKTSLKENLDIKNKLIQEAKKLVNEDISNSKKLESVTSQFKRLQENWKKTGPVPRNISDKIWKEFRSYFDEFFAKRKEILNIEKGQLKENYNSKLLLIETAKKYVENVANDSNPLLIKKLQEKWKNIGHSGRFAEQKLWKKFRIQCDNFFDAKNKNKNAILTKEKENLKSKISLLDEIKKETKINFSKIMDFINRFQEVGEVPRKKSSDISKQFDEIISLFCSNNKFSSEENHQIKRAVKASFLSNSSNPDKAFIDEKNRINKLINQTIKETTQLENNLGFFSNAKGKMFDDFQVKIQKNNEKITDLRDELKKLSEAYHKK